MLFSWLITDNKSLNNTDSNIKPKVWVETGQMHQRADNVVDHNDNTILDENNEVGMVGERRRNDVLYCSSQKLDVNGRK